MVRSDADARFAGMMKAYMTKKGVPYLMLNEKLKHDPDLAVSVDEFEQGRDTVRTGMRRAKRGHIRRALCIAAVVVLCVMAMSATALAVSPELREQVFHLFVSRGGDFSLGETLDADIDPKVVYHYSEPAVPDGYASMSEDADADDICYVRTYYYEDSSIISVYIISAADNMTLGGYDEAPKVQESVHIGDFEGTYEVYSVEGLEGDSLVFRLADTAHGAYIRVSGYGADVTRETLQSIAEQLHYVGG